MFNTKKGQSLAINQMIIFILALIVLAVMLGFLFGGIGGPGTEIDLRAQQEILCGRYVRDDPKCDMSGDVEPDIVNNLTDVCTKLGFSECRGGLDKLCLKNCCELYCPG